MSNLYFSEDPKANTQELYEFCISELKHKNYINEVIDVDILNKFVDECLYIRNTRYGVNGIVRVGNLQLWQVKKSIEDYYVNQFFTRTITLLIEPKN